MKSRMITITLPDGAKKIFDAPAVTPREVAEAIGPRLARDAIGALINGQLSDLNAPIRSDAAVAIITATADDPHATYLLRHSCAHVLAEAISTLFPAVKLAYGPPVEEGFYYDMELADPIRQEDFARIEAEMARIIAENRPFTRYEMPPAEAMNKLQREGNPYKVDNARRALEQDANTTMSFYVTGAPGTNWEDLCRGPHLPATGRIGAFKITGVAAAWRAPTGAATPRNSSCSGCMERRFFPRPNWTPGCSNWRRQKSGTTGCSANNWGFSPFLRWSAVD
jgi:threonyl-tRNA synthetase